jgi:hypothetical protein
MISRSKVTVCGVAFVGLVLALVTGCATTKQPALVDAKLVPAKVSPGEETVVQVKLVDPQGIVSVVVATVREYPEISFDLNDSGEYGDAVPGDSIWSYAMEVPGEAPPGEYNWDFEAYDADGNLVKIAGDGGEMAPLTAEASVEILF